MIDEVSLVSEDLSDVVVVREGVKALVMKPPVPVVLNSLFFKDRRLTFDYAEFELQIE